MQNVNVAPLVPRPASTVMLVRPAGTSFAVYMIRRSTKSRFMPAVHVFPGGAVDPEDGAPAMLPLVEGWSGPPGPEFAVAAMRELFEEVGILLACDAAGRTIALAAEALAHLRAERAAGADFATSLARRGLRLDASGLAYYSHWITPPTERIRFDARFFLARAPADQIAEADAVEVHDGEWIVPADALARADDGVFPIIFPTRQHLERLAGFADVGALFAHARRRVVRAITPCENADGSIGFACAEDATW